MRYTLFPNQPYPFIRRATEGDFASIYMIWMQDHVIQYMSFPKMSANEFSPVYAALARESDIYVMIDRIDSQDTVVAVRRLVFGRGESVHCVSFCSLGVHQDYRGRGYATLFYQLLFQIIEKDYPQIKRIDLTQSQGNDAAIHLAGKFQFNVEAYFSGWLRREKSKGEYYLDERFICRLLDSAITSNNSLLSAVSKVPSFKVSFNSNVKADYKNTNENLIFDLFFGDRCIGQCVVTPGKTVLQHIGFVSIKFNDNNYKEMQSIIREVILQIKRTGLKKIGSVPFFL